MSSRIKQSAALAGVVVAVVAVAGCGGSSGSNNGSPSTTSSTTSSPSSSPSSGTSSGMKSMAMITIKGFKYSGASTVKPGATVMVKNDDSVTHTVTSDKSGGFDVTVSAGKTATFKAPSTAGTYAYHCTFHSNMHGSLKVS